MNILIFGDSITWGAGDSEKGGWVERLKIYLAENYEAYVYNLGVPGDTTEELLRRIDSECQARKPDIIVFAIGINDSQHIRTKDNPRVPLNQFQENLEQIYQIAKQFTKQIVFAGLTSVEESKTTPIPWAREKHYDNAAIRAYDNAIKNFCDNRGLLFIKMSQVLSNDDLEDGLHPNSKGHEKIFEIVRGVLIQKNIISSDHG